ncbi:MAG: hypothetical protein R3F17_06310 [Planctomycetota bacterium]
MILSVTLTAATFDVDFKVYGAGCSPQELLLRQLGVGQPPMPQ